jgi:RNA polymerase sigma-70 factor (ECF subfamily)
VEALAHVVVANSCSDEQVVSCVLAGETQLFEVIVHRHSRKLYRVALSILRSEGHAEDVVQDTLCSAYQHLAQFAGRSAFVTWLTRIALHRALAELRARRFEVPLENDEGLPIPVLAHPGRNPEQAVYATETARVLHSAIRALPENYRRVLLMRDIDEMDTETTARKLRITQANVKVRLHRARIMLRRESAMALKSASAADPSSSRNFTQAHSKPGHPGGQA